MTNRFVFISQIYFQVKKGPSYKKEIVNAKKNAQKALKYCLQVRPCLKNIWFANSYQEGLDFFVHIYFVYIYNYIYIYTNYIFNKHSFE